MNQDFVALGAGNILSGFAGVIRSGREPRAHLGRLRCSWEDPGLRAFSQHW